MIYLRQSTASQSVAIGPFVDDTDYKTPETALTIANTDIKIVVNGGASANKTAGGGTHRVNGVYGVTFDATDTATVGELEYSVVVAGALPVFGRCMVLEEAVYDNLFAAAAIGPMPVYTQPTGFLAATFPAGTLANTTNITAGVITTTTNLTNLPTMPANWITTVGITDGAYTAAKFAENYPTLAELTAEILVGTTAVIVQGDAAWTTGTGGDVTVTAASHQALIELMFTYDTSATYGTEAGSLVDQIVDNTANEVWDEILTGQTHNIRNSAGRLLRQPRGSDTSSLLIHSGTAQSGASTTITLDTGASATDDIYNGSSVLITGSTGVGQTRRIVDYNGTTKVATITPDWTTTPAGTSTFEVWSATVDSLVAHEGLAQAGAATTITLDTGASANDDIYNGSLITITAGTSVGETREVTDYNGTTKVATVNTAWSVNPDSTSVFAVIPALADIDGNPLTTYDLLVAVELGLDDAIPELSVGVPAATPSVRTALMLMYMGLRNTVDVSTSGTDVLLVKNDAGTTIAKKLLVDAAGDYTEAKMISG